MLRITEFTTVDGIVKLKLEGTLQGQWVALLRELTDRRPTIDGLELSGLTFADLEGVQLLHELTGRGTILEGQSGFVSALLTTDSKR